MEFDGMHNSPARPEKPPQKTVPSDTLLEICPLIRRLKTCGSLDQGSIVLFSHQIANLRPLADYSRLTQVSLDAHLGSRVQNRANARFEQSPPGIRILSAKTNSRACTKRLMNLRTFLL